MTVLQVWLIVGIPVLAVALVLFLAGSPVARLLGYLVLAAGFGVMAVLDRTSAAVFGGLLALLYAAGQGGPGTRDELTGGPQPSAGRQLPPDRHRFQEPLPTA